MIDCEYIAVEEKRVECCKVEDQNDIGYEEIKMLMSVKIKKGTEIIEEKIECCRIKEKNDELIRKLISNVAKKDDGVIDNKKVEDIRMLKSSRRLVSLTKENIKSNCQSKRC